MLQTRNRGLLALASYDEEIIPGAIKMIRHDSFETIPEIVNPKALTAAEDDPGESGLPFLEKGKTVDIIVARIAPWVR